MTTRRLYYHDAYRTEFEARLVDRSDDGLRVYLAETAFYPTSGGQPHDVGTIGDARVIDVVDEDDRIAHLLDRPIAADAAPARVDWARRWDHMQQHTGQHLISALFDELLGRPTTSVHFGAERSTVDVVGEGVSRADLLRVEERANALVAEARPVAMTFEDAASATGLRKPTGRSGEIRIVSIDGVDRSACGGTHVRSSAEIGPVLLRGIEKIRKDTRIEFLCGARALRRARADHDALTAIAASVKAPLDDAAAFVADVQRQLVESERRRKAADAQLSAYQANELYAAAPVDADGVRRLRLADPAGGMDALRHLATALQRHAGWIFVGSDAPSTTVVFATAADTHIDAGRRLRDLLGVHGGRGGGNERIAQGGSLSAEAMRAVAESLVATSGAP